MNFTVTVFGLGFVGLTTALGLAEKGHKVFGVDVDDDRRDTLKAGKLPFVEPGLDEALIRHLDRNFSIAADPVDAVRQSVFIFLCVGTPCGQNGEADLSHVFSALDMFSSVLNDGNYRVVVIKSTVPPSTTHERVIPYLREKGLNPGETFGVANNPEFLREGKCWDDFMNTDRFVCGVNEEKSAQMLQSLYSSFQAPFFAVSLNTGEFIKYLSNTMLATMISFANELSKIAYTIGDVDTKSAFQILHMDHRWGNCNMKTYVYPGCGYGGYCLPKDIQAMYAQAVAKGFEPTILKNVITTNETMPAFMVEKIRRLADPSEKIGILGLSFKPESDDVRDSAAAKIITQLQESGYCNLSAYDPIANSVFKSYYDFDLDYCATMTEICEKSDALIIVTAWKEFAGLDKKYPAKKVVDCRYFL